MEVSWENAAEEASEVLYKWGRFLLDHGRYGEGLVLFWEIYERFLGTRWHSQVFEELVDLEKSEEMVFVNGGAFGLGKEESEIHLGPYFIDRHPVTNAQYWEFVKATGHSAPIHWIGEMYPIGKANHPVVWVCHEDSLAYARWRSKRLPTEGEWEKASRGEDARIWPWGDVYEPRRCNGRAGGMGDTTPVGHYPDGDSPHRCQDMIGNVWEWTDSWYEPEKTRHKVLRGGSWFSFENFTTAVYRNFDYPGAKSGLYGFRCAKTFCRPEKM